VLIRRTNDILPSEITPEAIYLRRREFMTRTALTAAAGLLPLPLAAEDAQSSALSALNYRKATSAGIAGSYTNEMLTPFQDATHYNNFYEFGTDKGDPAEYAGAMETAPWSVTVEGEVESRALIRSKIYCAVSILRSGFIGCAVSRRGRWWCRGSDFPCRHC